MSRQLTNNAEIVTNPYNFDTDIHGFVCPYNPIACLVIEKPDEGFVLPEPGIWLEAWLWEEKPWLLPPYKN